MTTTVMPMVRRKLALRTLWKTNRTMFLLSSVLLLLMADPTSSLLVSRTTSWMDAAGSPSCMPAQKCGNSARLGSSASTRLSMAQVSEKEARTGIDKVVNALRRDKTAKDELGNLVKVNNILGYGSPSQGTLAVRFNASFRKSGFGRSSVPLPFGLGQTNESEGRGTMVGQVKASIDMESGKLTSCSVFRDLGYGRAFNLKV